MSRIQNVNQNYVQLGNLNAKNVNNPPLNFGSATITAEDAAVKAYGKVIDKQHGVLGWISKALNKNDGEVQTQLVNALFTTTLAPAFIAFNPFSKEDKETKQYTALRQPISAVIAVGVGVGATLPFNNFLESMASKGCIKPIDLRMDPNVNYLKRQFKRECKEAEKNGKLAEFKKLYADKNRDGAFDFDSYAAVKKEQAKQTFVKLLYEDPNTLKNDTQLKAEMKDLNKYIANNNLHERNFKDFMKEHFKIKCFKENEGAGVKEEALKSQLKEIKAMEFLRKAGLVKGELNPQTGKYAEGSFTEEQLKAFLASKRQEPVVEAIMKAGVNDANAKKIAEELGKETARQIQRSATAKDVETVTLSQMLDALKIDESKFIEDVKNKKMATFLNEFSTKHLSGLKEVKGKGLKDFANNIISYKIKRVNSDFKNFGKYAGMVFALCTLPISCGLLNWSYPRIMERYFPRLANSKQKKGGN